MSMQEEKEHPGLRRQSDCNTCICICVHVPMYTVHVFMFCFPTVCVCMCREMEEVVECFLDECASPQQLVQSFKPKMPPQ